MVIQRYVKKDAAGREHVYLITSRDQQRPWLTQLVHCYAALVAAGTGFTWADASQMHAAHEWVTT